MMPLCLSAVLCLTVNLVRRAFKAQWKEPVLGNPLLQRLEPIAGVVDIPKEFRIFKSLVLIQTVKPL